MFSGFKTNSDQGKSLLGCYLSTNIVSWIFVAFKNRNILFKISGIIGLLDLPLYVLFPQIGLKHWILVGGSIPEPLLAARMIGIPDLLFYSFLLISTSALIYLYFDTIKLK